MGKDWFCEWFDENYLLIYSHRDKNDAEMQIALLLENIKPEIQDKILDLGCGEGRHVSILKNKGFDVTGIDLSESLLKSGKSKYPCLKLLQGDMRNIPGKFNIILSLFTSFGYFEEDSENKKVIEGVYDSLEKGGHFWLDFLNSEYVRDNIIKDSEFVIGDEFKVCEKREISGNRIIKNIFLNKNGEKREYKESVRLFSREELTEILEASGFIIKKVYGNYSGENWEENSPRTIIHSYKY